MSKLQYIVLIILIVAILPIVFLLVPKQNKIAYIKNVVVMEEYQGMLDGKKAYDTKLSQWQANIDTLKFGLQKNINLYNAEYNSLSQKDRDVKERLIQRQQNELQQYVNTLEQKAAQEDQDIMQGVLNQVNAFVEEYAKKQGYDFVFGTTINGNIMYAGDAYDITEEVIKGLNAQYATGK